MLSPVGGDGIVEINGYYLYNTKYLRETQMDYDHLIPESSSATCASGQPDSFGRTLVTRQLRMGAIRAW